MNIVPIGGRIKAAAVGLAHLFAERDVIPLQRHLRYLRQQPPQELLTAFFPGDRARLRQMMEGIGFYRPCLKTDQGMPGNFLEFRIDAGLEQTRLSPVTVVGEEGLIIPEEWCKHDPAVLEAARSAFLQFDLLATLEVLGSGNGSAVREADKGRTPYFLVRPAAGDRVTTFGQDIVERVETEVAKAIGQIYDRAARAELELLSRATPPNLIYCQADAYVLADGSVHIEKIHCPDVGFFLGTLDPGGSRILPGVQDVVRKLLRQVARQINTQAGDELTLLVRDEVLQKKEDVLELREIRALERAVSTEEAFGLLGCRPRVRSVSQVDDLSRDSTVLLLNVDYAAPGADDIIRRHARGELRFFPNPFVQMAARDFSGLKSTVCGGKHYMPFLQLIGSHPKSEEGVEDVLFRINQLLHRQGVASDILHVEAGNETVPVFKPSLHSWNQLHRRRLRQPQADSMVLREVPATPDNLLLTGSTGPRLHVYRFMCC